MKVVHRFSPKKRTRKRILVDISKEKNGTARISGEGFLSYKNISVGAVLTLLSKEANKGVSIYMNDTQPPLDQHSSSLVLAVSPCDGIVI